ncbi:aminoglycoside 6'-N-acetyltransferase [Limnoraphis robusta]|uniref:Aminoglycoside N(6')-acetyltransferase type 1 n=1 Tax=Limnoraphis robusta CCNP1315 TaxID=3110306 RepID=A0ABU5U663_9CYAN|nr:aminoglycoside 6'-N-acetyltransferase [Limnoraphis robusta]MEA5498827.1 aminoglycoside 6'-N-acetyltransferase [Limnoraphis robusta BA-68 BA1]MEA5522646.1 aminoglycoside 6'-N-acetyltransferase [Limnoraphis robusta CCNP1315]MEA5546557.1 aminoglycoside 6'-N-acetyltransferase [Limnoraphis robusta CCNP1324]
MKIRQVRKSDAFEWLRMRNQLWYSPPESLEEHSQEIDQYYSTNDPHLETFVIERPNGKLGGFLEVNIRSYAEGCKSSRVGYIEGWYVDSDLRRQGWGKALVLAAENWAKQKGIEEMASDCELDNSISLQAHLALGYLEVERIICFRKVLKKEEF